MYSLSVFVWKISKPDLYRGMCPNIIPVPPSDFIILFCTVSNIFPRLKEHKTSDHHDDGPDYFVLECN